MWVATSLLIISTCCFEILRREVAQMEGETFGSFSIKTHQIHNPTKCKMNYISDISARWSDFKSTCLVCMTMISFFFFFNHYFVSRAATVSALQISEQQTTENHPLLKWEVSKSHFPASAWRMRWSNLMWRIFTTWRERKQWCPWLSNNICWWEKFKTVCILHHTSHQNKVCKSIGLNTSNTVFPPSAFIWQRKRWLTSRPEQCCLQHYCLFILCAALWPT